MKIQTKLGPHTVDRISVQTVIDTINWAGEEWLEMNCPYFWTVYQMMLHG